MNHFVFAAKGKLGTSTSLSRIYHWDNLNMYLQEYSFLVFFPPSFLQIPREEGGSCNLAAGLH